jgi:hypothetical protein
VGVLFLLGMYGEGLLVCWKLESGRGNFSFFSFFATKDKGYRPFEKIQCVNDVEERKSSW